ncbi:hypothetical protein TNCV_3981281 [Trichonephila clavipes]|nr:hypothetical protein TNCV_3981281 [Trichonephila clavipes]
MATPGSLFTPTPLDHEDNLELEIPSANENLGLDDCLSNGVASIRDVLCDVKTSVRLLLSRVCENGLGLASVRTFWRLQTFNNPSAERLFPQYPNMVRKKQKNIFEWHRNANPTPTTSHDASQPIVTEEPSGGTSMEIKGVFLRGIEL